MRNFPVFLRTTGASVVVVGGGETAAQKVRLLARTDAALTVMAPALIPELEAARTSGRITHVVAELDTQALAGARLVVVAVEDADLVARAVAGAHAAGALVNVVDRPEICDALVPAIVDRDPVVVAVGTEGTAPVLAREIRAMVERMLEPDLGHLAALAGRLRGRVADRIAPARRRAFWEWFFGPLRSVFRADGLDTASQAVDAVLAEGVVPADARPRVTLIAAPDSADLMTLRAHQSLQEAAVLFLDPGTDPALAELARRDAERIALPAASPERWQRLDQARLVAAHDGPAVWLIRGTTWAAERALTALGAEWELIGPGSAWGAGAEDRRADADMGGAKRHRPLEISAHAH